MKWGGLYRKVENVFFVKSGPFLNAGCIMYSISIFLHFTYFGGGAYAPPPAYGPGQIEGLMQLFTLNNVTE